MDLLRRSRTFSSSSASRSRAGARLSPDSRSISSRSLRRSSPRGRFSAIRRERLLRMVRTMLRFAGEPVTLNPARVRAVESVCFTCFLTSSGSSRSSRNRSTNSCRLSTNWNSSSPPPSGLPSRPPRPPPAGGRGSLSPGTNSLLPGRTWLRMPPPCDLRNSGSLSPCEGMTTRSPCAMSATLRRDEASCTTFAISARARRMNRWRLPMLFPLGLRRRSMMYTGTVRPSNPDMRRPGYPACFTRMYHSTSRRTWRSV